MMSPDHSHVVPSISRDMRGLYEAHFPFVWRYLSHRGVPTASLDDVVLDVFRIVREHPSRRDPAIARNVLVCMIARQVLKSFMRRNAKLAQPEEDGLDGDGPTQTFSRQAAAQVLEAALEQMTEMQREVLLLCCGEKLSTHDVANALGVGESTTQLRLQSAQKALQAFIKRLRNHPLWHTMADAAPRELLDQAQAARTPTDNDRERVFASLLALSIATSAPAIEVVCTEPAPRFEPPPPLELPRPTPIVGAPTGPMPHTAAEATEPLDTPAPPPRPQPETATLPPPVPRTSTTWAAAIFAAVAIASGTYIAISSGHAAPLPEETQAASALPAEPDVAPVAATAQGQDAPEAPEPSGEAIEGVTLGAAEGVGSEVEADGEQPSAGAGQRGARRAKQRAWKRRRPSRKTKTRVDTSAEAKQLFAAETALKLGKQRLALDMVREHAQRFPRSKLDAERNALRAQALCELGRTKAARRVVLELEAANENSQLVASVDHACMH